VVRTKATLGRSVARTVQSRTARPLDGFLKGGGARQVIFGGKAGEGGLEITKLAFLSGSKPPFARLAARRAKLRRS
jgi:hypothetical protein